MEDFTGGVTETFDLKKATAKLEGIMVKSVARQSLMCCSIEAKPNEIEAKLDNGLIKGHAYSITSVKKVREKLNSSRPIKPNCIFAHLLYTNVYFIQTFCIRSLPLACFTKHNRIKTWAV